MTAPRAMGTRRPKSPVLMLIPGVTVPLVLLCLAGSAPFLATAFGAAGIAALTVALLSANGKCPLTQRTTATEQMELMLRHAGSAGHVAGTLAVQIDQIDTLITEFGTLGMTEVDDIVVSRLQDNLGTSDNVYAVAPGRYLILMARSRLGLDSAVQRAARLQAAASHPFDSEMGQLHLSLSLGICLSNRIKHPTGADLLRGAEIALSEALRHGPGAIRSYSTMMHSRVRSRDTMVTEVARALTDGQIRAYFQPQICAQSGAVSGFEALARWHHPDRGLIPPVEFLPALERAGLMGRLGTVMVDDSLKALSMWRSNGLVPPRIGVNLSDADLRDGQLVDRIGFELDRYNVPADRLAVEVLETVVASATDDTVIDNLARLSRLGCSIDLDDFGTGHASITNIRRFSVNRIKIDRTFVSGVDHDQEQLNTIIAIITMAERLGLETLAEGVETDAERRTLAKLGCGHLQGYGIARPMPLDAADDWLNQYLSDRTGVVPLHRHVG